MNPVPHNPQPFKLQWVPMEPSWIVSIGLILLAVLPHQIPTVGREALQSWVGGLAFAGLSFWVTTQSPVLGVAMLLLLVGIIADGWRGAKGLKEGFHSTITTSTLQKDHVTTSGRDKKQHRWFEEEVLMEEPSMIQDKSEDPGLLFDRVTASDRSNRWFDEEQLGEYPVAIQERPVWSFGESDE